MHLSERTVCYRSSNMKKQILVFFICSSFVSSNAGIFECNTHLDCPLECEDGVCKCPPKQALNLLGTKCLELVSQYHESCEDDNQCGLLGGSHMCDPDTRNCVCAKGWVYLKGTCIELLKTGDRCNENDDCYDGIYSYSRICKDKKCTCNDGYYDRQGFDCRPIKNPGEACSIDLDCKNSTCEGRLCSGRGNFGNLRRDDSDVTYRHSQQLPQPFSLLTDCVNSDSCTEKYTYCSPIFGKCLCKKGYFPYGTKCESELGSKCDRGMCEGYGMFCNEDATCLCKDGYFNGVGNRVCDQDSAAPNFYCNDDEECRIFGNHFQCNFVGSNKQCVCENGYRLNENYLCEPCRSTKRMEDGNSYSTSSEVKSGHGED